MNSANRASCNEREPNPASSHRPGRRASGTRQRLPGIVSPETGPGAPLSKGNRPLVSLTVRGHALPGRRRPESAACRRGAGLGDLHPASLRLRSAPGTASRCAPPRPPAHDAPRSAPSACPRARPAPRPRSGPRGAGIPAFAGAGGTLAHPRQPSAASCAAVSTASPRASSNLNPSDLLQHPAIGSRGASSAPIRSDTICSRQAPGPQVTIPTA